MWSYPRLPAMGDSAPSRAARQRSKSPNEPTMRPRNTQLLAAFLAAATPTSASAASGRMTMQSHSDVGAKCIDVPYAQISRGMRLQMWNCGKVVVWGQPNTEVTLGVARKSGRSEIRVRLGEAPVDGPAAQAFTYDEKSQQLKIGSLCVESWGQGEAQDAVGLGACSNGDNQRWKLVQSGQYQQIVGIKGLCLEPRNGAKDDGVPLDLAECANGRTQQLWTLKQPTRGVLGVQWRKPTDQEETLLSLEHGVGIIVEKVLPGGPSEKSGLVPGDAIATIDGRPIGGAALTPPATKKGSTACSRYMPSVGLTVRVPCDEYIGGSK
jgi:hypothetical protein